MNDANSPLLSDTSRDVEWVLPRHPRSVGRFRLLLRRQTRAWWIPDEVAETAALLLSELTTNACRHAHASPGREIGARCLVRDGDDAFRTLRVEVSDACDDLPKPRSASTCDESGRGLTLVEALADAWDVSPRPYGIGKTVWFELRLPVPERLPGDADAEASPTE